MHEHVISDHCRKKGTILPLSPQVYCVPAVQLQWVLASDDRWPRTHIKAELRVSTIQPKAHKVSITSVLAIIPVLPVVEKNTVCGLRAE